MGKGMILLQHYRGEHRVLRIAKGSKEEFAFYCMDDTNNALIFSHVYDSLQSAFNAFNQYLDNEKKRGN